VEPAGPGVRLLALSRCRKARRPPPCKAWCAGVWDKQPQVGKVRQANMSQLQRRVAVGGAGVSESEDVLKTAE
jgi:hypothetical protein